MLKVTQPIDNILGNENLNNKIKSRNSIINNINIGEVYNYLIVELPHFLSNFRYENNCDPELYILPSDFLDKVILMADSEVGNFYESNFVGQTFERKIYITLREVFFQKIVENGIHYKDQRSIEYLERLVNASGCFEENGLLKFYVPKPIRLSVLLGHRFDGEQYSFKTKASKISLRRSNLRFFASVIRMMNFLKTKENLLYIDYPQYFEVYNNKDLVVPMELKCLHRFHQNSISGEKDCIYYSNYWPNSHKYKSVHSNAIMAILSYIKYMINL